MRVFFRSHQELALVACGILFVVLIVIYTGWGIVMLTANLARAITIGNTPAEDVGFHFENLGKLRLPGVQ